ncbi:MAG: aminotransferase class III-fold pyridoxal phosphate-dependent enzyme [Chloroflexia bacterium]
MEGAQEPARGLGEKGTRVLHFREAFHGRSGYTVSLTNTADPRKYLYFPKFEWPRALNPKLRFPLNDSNLAAVEEAERESVAQIEAAFEQYPDEIACIIIEPIQCEGGDNHFRPEFLWALRRIADERDALLIFDEVQTGMGMTGNMWARETLGVAPDLLVFGKKAQICGIASTTRVDEVERNVFVEGSRINSTWGGSIADYARGQRYLEIILADDLLANARSQGEYLLRSLRSLESKGLGISNSRGLGLLVAFDLPDGPTRDKLLQDAFDSGMLLLSCGTLDKDAPTPGRQARGARRGRRKIRAPTSLTQPPFGATRSDF